MMNRFTNNKNLTIALYALVSTFSLLIFLKNAWVAEDAFIILRSVDQFLLGHGFRWNPHERVQVYTSPLWYLLIIASTAFCKTLYLNLIGLSLLLHSALLIVMAVLIKNVWRWIAATLLLTLSQAFFDFTASGLEYPLVYLLLAAFVLLYLRNQHIEDRYWLALSGGLALITRHDLLFILTPMVLHLVWSYHKQLTTRQQLTTAIIFIAPLSSWTLFSLIYYGLPFPNTAYAKLGISGVSRIERLERSWIYLSVSLQKDPITPLCIAFAILQGFCSRNIHYKISASSLLLAFLYITWIGADYMAGRFYAPLYLVSTLVLTTCCWKKPVLHRSLATATGLAAGYMIFYTIESNIEVIAAFITARAWPLPKPESFLVTLTIIGLALATLSTLSQRASKSIAVLFLALLSISTQLHDSPWQTSYRDWGKNSDFDMWWNLNNVSRERYFIYHWTSLYAWRHRDTSKPFPDHPWCYEGQAMPDIQIIGLVGITAYCMGPDKIAVDIKALTDPLLTRIPKAPEAKWLSGGVNRMVPAGYLASLQTGENRIEDPDLARYYEKLAILTQEEPLFSTARIKTIVAFNLGFYEPWLAAYKERNPGADTASPP